MTIPFAALVALLAALLETTVLPELAIAGATADLVLVCAISATLVLGVEDGLASAFLGGLLIDMLIASRPIGAATTALLLVVGVAIIVAKVAGPGRRWMAVALTVALTPLMHVILSLILVLTVNAPLAFQPTVVLVAAFMNGVVAIGVASVFVAIERRFGPTERVDL